MPKFPRIPRLSIVIPISADQALFEATLISVLENRPPSCEILVAHDGSYDDPFDLCDEVVFVEGETGDIVDLVTAGAMVARGRFVHVLADGIRATPGWADEALEVFEQHEVGAVAAVIRDSATERILAAGWRDTAASPGSPAASIPSPNSGESAAGPLLQASFWRRELIRCLGEPFPTTGSIGEADGLDSTYLLCQSLAQAGWKTVVAESCQVFHDQGELAGYHSPARSRRLRAIHGQLHGYRWQGSLGFAMRALLANALRPSRYLAALAQALAPLEQSAAAERQRVNRVPSCEPDQVVVKLPGTSERREAA